MEVIDWDLNVDANFASNRFMIPVAVSSETDQRGYREVQICYKSWAFSAKELTVEPGRTVTIYDQGAYGMIMMQGHGTMGNWNIETPALIRFGKLTK